LLWADHAEVSRHGVFQQEHPMAMPLKWYARQLSGGAAPVAESSYEEHPTSCGEAAVAAVCTWSGQAGWARRFRLLPDGCADLFWDGDAFAALAPSRFARASRLRRHGRTAGLRLRAGFAGAVLGVPLRSLSNGPVRLATLWGALGEHAERRLARATSLSEQRIILEQIVACRLDDGAEPDDAVVEAASALRSPAISMADVARSSGLGERELRRRFASHVGMGPKAFQLTARFAELVRRLPDLVARRASIAALALELGYADQAHMTRECLRISGSTPGVLVRTWSV
jgi:AraC-like DNA-binding protein